MARNVKATKKIEGNVVTITFQDGALLTASLTDMKPDIITRLALHGLSQKLGDSYASPDVDPQESATGVLETLLAGKWSDRAEGTGETSTTLLAEAYVRVKKLTGADAVPKITAVLNAKPKEYRAAMRKNPDIAAAMAAIQAERKAKKAASVETVTLEDLA